ncbi:MAG: hypothetical protein Q8L93_00570 [Rhodocyclaceae bacterium]|nr:hypothetical protein [Rhodocyclaceae bacterium]
MGSENKTGGSFLSAGCDERDWYLARIDLETNRLMQNVASQAHTAITLVSGANAGGAVALLAYIAQLSADASQAKTIHHSTIVLTLFVAGFFFALLLAVCVYYFSAFRLREWNHSVGTFYRGDTQWRGLWDGRSKMWAAVWLPHILGWLSLLFFLGGAGLGLTEMLCATSVP